MIVLVGCFYGYTASGGPSAWNGDGESMVLNIVMVHLIGMIGTHVFCGANPRGPIRG